MKLHPMPGFVLVELATKYKNVSASMKAYEQANSGVLVEGELDKVKIGDTVIWTEMLAGAPIIKDDRIYCFVPVKAIEGYEIA